MGLSVGKGGWGALAWPGFTSQQLLGAALGFSAQSGAPRARGESLNMARTCRAHPSLQALPSKAPTETLAAWEGGAASWSQHHTTLLAPIGWQGQPGSTCRPGIFSWNFHVSLFTMPPATGRCPCGLPAWASLLFPTAFPLPGIP